MRIISKYHDYYDTALGYAFDPDLIYHRTIQSWVFERWVWDPKVLDVLSMRPWWFHFEPRLVVLGFCCRCYPIWLDSSVRLDEGFLGSHANPVTWLSKEELVTSYVKSFGRRVRRQGAPHFRSQLDIIEAYWGKELAPDLSRDLNAPHFIVYESPISWGRNKQGVIISNPRLATLGFASVLDAFATFQEIAMFLGSTLAGTDDAPRTVGDDRVIAAAKGFDDQSFRTLAPGNRKLNRKANRLRKRQVEQENG